MLWDRHRSRHYYSYYKNWKWQRFTITKYL